MKFHSIPNLLNNNSKRISAKNVEDGYDKDKTSEVSRMKQEEYEYILAKHRVPVNKLRMECQESFFSFETTAEMLETSNEMIGQQRAVEAMEFGLAVKQSGYNLFIVGPAGTGKMTFTQSRVNDFASNQPVPNDQCYVYNFENPDQPSVISLPAGMGQYFQQRMQKLLIEIERKIQVTFSSDEFEYKKRNLLDEYKEKKGKLWRKIDKFANEQGYHIERSATGVTTYPLLNGKPLDKLSYDQLSEESKEKLKMKGKIVENKVSDTVNQIRKIDDNLEKSMDLFMKQTAASSIEPIFQPIYEEYAKYSRVITYLKNYFQDIVEHFHLFLAEESMDEQSDIIEAIIGTRTQQLQRYAVNLFVNNKMLKGAPVIYETNPSYQNLFGKIEYRGALGSLITDFTFIKPGALHLANGGYLILQASELFQEPYAWNLLKRMLQTGKAPIENPLSEKVANPTSGMKPEPIDLNIKVILIGSYYLYEMLSTYDEDFHKLFKVKVEFDTEMDKTDENNVKMASFVKKFAEEEGLLPFHRSAIAHLINYSSRLVDQQDKLSTQFHQITKILVEANYWAMKEQAKVVTNEHVKKALSEQVYRSNRLAEKYQEMIVNGTIMVETDGERVGQMNGLAVMGTRDYIFGIPSKITAQTFVGKSGIMNIEREASLSGQIHHKGLLILTGYLSGTFAKNKMLPLSASITFEQSYQMIDGDSASSTELYVLLSSLSGTPIKQGIAATGSVNQWGQIQAIGGVNDKIEGFYEICKKKGLTNQQGVIIPKQNIKNLMLNDEVVEAVKDGKFHIWAVETVAEGIEILTGIRAGDTRNETGNFPENTIFARVEERFARMYQTARKATSAPNTTSAPTEITKK